MRFYVLLFAQSHQSSPTQLPLPDLYKRFSISPPPNIHPEDGNCSFYRNGGRFSENRRYFPRKPKLCMSNEDLDVFSRRQKTPKFLWRPFDKLQLLSVRLMFHGPLVLEATWNDTRIDAVMFSCVIVHENISLYLSQRRHCCFFVCVWGNLVFPASHLLNKKSWQEYSSASMCYRNWQKLTNPVE